MPALRRRPRSRGRERCGNRLSYSNIGDEQPTIRRRRVRASRTGVRLRCRFRGESCARASTRGTVAPDGPGTPRRSSSGGSVEEAFAQTPYVPYFGKNRIRYNDFKWNIYKTDHFEIYYYPEIEPHLERVTSYAESAYQQVSSDLKHDLAFKVPLVLYKTQSEFQQQNIEPGELPEGVLAFAEPYRDRMVLPIDEPSDALYRLITHELTHIFEFDIIPRSLLRRSLPLWVDEGLSDYMTGYWQPFDLMTVRDAAIADIVPSMSDFEGVAFVDGRLPYNLGHAAFEFIESRWGKEGLRQFLFALRKAVIGGGESAYEEAFRLKPEEFDEQFDKYLKDRFKPFRDKERPADYGSDLAPKRGKTPYTVVVSIEPSPSGDLMAVAAGNRKDQELDIVLMSTKDGKVIRNLTGGFNKDQRLRVHRDAGRLPQQRRVVDVVGAGRRSHRLLRAHREEQDAHPAERRHQEDREADRAEDASTARSRPTSARTARKSRSPALRGAIGDIFIVNLETGQIRNVTNDDVRRLRADLCARRQVDHLSRARQRQRQAVQARPRHRHEDPAHVRHARRRRRAVHRCRHDRVPVDRGRPEPADRPRSRAQRQHLQHLDAQPEERRAEAVHRHADGQRLADRPARSEAGEDRLRHLLQGRVRHPHAAARGTAPHGGERRLRLAWRRPSTSRRRRRTRWSKSNIHKKGTFEKLFLEGRPPVALGVTSGGDLFGGTAGDVHRRARRQAVQHVRLVGRAVPDAVVLVHEPVAAACSTRCRRTRRRSSTTATIRGCSTAPSTRYVSRDQAIATQTARGATVFGIYPLNRYARVELSAGIFNYEQGYNDPQLQDVANQYQTDQYGRLLFSTGTFMPFGASLVRETTVFREYGPLAGNTVRLGYEYAPPVGSLLSRQTADVDARYYLRLATNGVLAFRARGYKSWGEFPGYLYFGGNSELRGYDYLEFLGNKAFFLNAELRFPLIEAALTPLGVIGGLRGVAFAGLGAAGYEGIPTKVWTRDPVTVTPLLGFQPNFQTLTYDPGLRATRQHRRIQAAGRPRLLRRRARDVRAGLPHPLRLVVADADEQGLRGLRVLVSGHPGRR